MMVSHSGSSFSSSSSVTERREESGRESRAWEKAPKRERSQSLRRAKVLLIPGTLSLFLVPLVSLDFSLVCWVMRERTFEAHLGQFEGLELRKRCNIVRNRAAKLVATEPERLERRRER